MTNRPSKKSPTTAPRQPDSPLRDAISRLLCIAFLLFLAYMLGTMGQQILKTGSYDYRLDSGDVSSVNNVRHEEVHATDAWALEQGRGFVAMAATLVFWSFIMLWGMAGPLALGSRWTPFHSLLTVVSLGGWGTALFWFFPPWRIGWTIGYDLAREKVEVCPTAHFNMGGIRINRDCFTNLEGLFAAGEDSSGVHGANRLGGNGVAESTVFGARAGDVVAGWVKNRKLDEIQTTQVAEATEAAEQFLNRQSPIANCQFESPWPLRDELGKIMWDRVGIVRSGEKLKRALGVFRVWVIDLIGLIALID